jgi:hypothetical protein
MEQFLETFFSWQNLKDSAPSVIEGLSAVCRIVIDTDRTDVPMMGL